MLGAAGDLDGPRGGGVLGLVGLPVVGEPERRLVRGVVAQHVEDEALLDGLLHRVQVERMRRAVDALVPEQFQGLGLRGGGEREERQVLRLRPGGHLRRQHVLGVDRAAVVEFVQLGGRQGRLEPLGRFPGLRGVGLVGDDREVLALQVGLGADQLQGEGEGLDGDDDDLRPAGAARRPAPATWPRPARRCGRPPLGCGRSGGSPPATGYRGCCGR